MHALCVLLEMIVLAQGGADLVFQSELWPGEGRPRFITAAATLQPRAEPSNQAAIMQLIPVRKGETVEFGQTSYRTTAPGRLRALAASTVNGRRLGPIVRLSIDDYYFGKYPAVSVPVAAGEAFDYLQYRAEGTCFVRIRGDVIDANPCPQESPKAFVLEAQPAIEWWIELLVAGRSHGWLLVDGKNVKESGRTF